MTATIIEAALRALLLAAVAALGLRLLRIRNVPARKAVWSSVLLGSLAMPLLMRWPAAAGLRGVGWDLPTHFASRAVVPASKASGPVVAVASQPRRDLRKGAAPAQGAIAPIFEAAQPSDITVSVRQPVAATRRSVWHWPAPGRLIPMIYLAVSGALLLRLVWGLAAALLLWTRADLVSPLVAPEPNVRASAKVPSPVTIGLGIVLPADYVHWERRKLRMVLAHERAHVRGCDFYLQLLAGLYTALFWFSPLGWWLRRTLTVLGEAMSDRAGMDVAGSRTDYAQIVLEFAALPRRTLPGVAMARSGNLSRRVEAMLNEGLFRRAFAEGRRRARLALLLVPVALFAATALIRVPAAQAAQSWVVAQNTAPVAGPATASEPLQSAPAPATAPEDGAPQAPAPADGPVTGPDQAPVVEPDPAAAPHPAPQVVPDAAPAPAVVPPTPPAPADVVGPAAPAVAPVPPAPTNSMTMVSGDHVISMEGPESGSRIVRVGRSISGFEYQFSDVGDSWAVVRGPGEDNFSFSGDGAGDIRAQIDKARSMTKGPFLWFSHDGKSYIINDPATLARIEAMYKPIEDLGRQQEELGRKQEELGRQQEELGRQEQASATVPDLSAKMEAIKAALAKLQAAQGKPMTQDELASIQEKLADLQGKLGDLQGEAGAKQGELGAQQGKLGEEQGKLGEQQGRLGAEQGRLAEEASRQVRSIIDQAVRDGTAKPVQ